MRVRTTYLVACACGSVIRTQELMPFVALLGAFAKTAEKIGANSCLCAEFLVQIRAVVAHAYAGQEELARRHFGQGDCMRQQARAQLTAAQKEPVRMKWQSKLYSKVKGEPDRNCMEPYQRKSRQK